MSDAEILERAMAGECRADGSSFLLLVDEVRRLRKGLAACNHNYIAVAAERDRLTAERDALIGSQIRSIAVNEWYQLPGNVGYETKSFSAPPVPFWNTRRQAVDAVRKAAGLPPETEAPL